MPIRRIPRGVLAALVVALFAGSAWSARIAVVHLTDRADPIEGELVEETADKVVLKIAGINTPISKDRIRELTYKPSLAEQYKAKRAELKDDDFDARYDLARWLYDQETMEAYQIALAELNDITARSPGQRQAQLLKRLVQQRIAALEAIQEDPGAENPPPDNGDGPAAPPTAERPKALEKDQRSLLKIYEINLKDKPRVTVPHKVADDFLDKYRAADALSSYNSREGRARFHRLANYEQLSLMFEVQARDMYGEVIVQDEPEALAFFKQNVNPRYVTGYFIRMFGEEPVPGLKLIKEKGNSEPSAYTNFLLLHRASVDGQKFINRDRPDQSLLLQWGLPRQDAAFPAPQSVKNFRPYFTGPGDERFVEMVNWIKRLYFPSPDYPIEFDPSKPDEPAGGDQAPAGDGGNRP